MCRQSSELSYQEFHSHILRGANCRLCVSIPSSPLFCFFLREEWKNKNLHGLQISFENILLKVYQKQYFAVQISEFYLAHWAPPASVFHSLLLQLCYFNSVFCVWALLRLALPTIPSFVPCSGLRERRITTQSSLSGGHLMVDCSDSTYWILQFVCQIL